MSRPGPAGKYNNFTQGSQSYSASNVNANPNAQRGEQLKSLRCVFCDTEKPLEAFSQTQIAKATFNPWAPPSYNNKKKTISCKKCTASQTTHLTCMLCSKTKTLDKFAKSQRRNQEKARCMQCIKKREEEDVWASDPDTESDEYGDFY